MAIYIPPVSTWDRHNNMAELNRLMESQPLPAQIRLHSKSPHINTKMNDNINIDSTIAGSMNMCS
jgi:hypothetical protein